MSEEDAVMELAAHLAGQAHELDDIVVVGQKKAGGYVLLNTESLTLAGAIYLLEIGKQKLFERMRSPE